MPDFTSGNYVYFKDNEEVPKSHHRVFILNQGSDFYITPPLKLLEESLSSLPKLFVKKLLNRGSIIISKLLLSYKK